MRYLARRDRSTIDRYTEDRERLAAERDRLLAARQEGERWILQERVRRTALVRLRGRQAALLAAAESERRTLAARADELGEREKKLAGLVDLLAKSREAMIGLPGQPGQSMQAFRGVLDWPAHGRVTAGFGPLLDPRYRTRVPHNGDRHRDCRGERGARRLPRQGALRRSLRGLRHDRRRASIRARLHPLRRARRVAGGNREDMVSLGQVVGSASDKLYFEIRVENHPENPSTWLR